MTEYEQALHIVAPPQELFDYVADIRNLPDYLPTVRHAEAQGEGRVRLQGEVNGHRYDSDGYFHVDRMRMRLEWGSDGENEYRGWLEVKENDGGLSSDVNVHLSFKPRADQKEQFREQSGDVETTIRQGLMDALYSIKNTCEGRGGKVEIHKVNTARR